jgi:hypothetical protein
MQQLSVLTESYKGPTTGLEAATRTNNPAVLPGIEPVIQSMALIQLFTGQYLLSDREALCLDLVIKYTLSCERRRYMALRPKDAW